MFIPTPPYDPVRLLCSDGRTWEYQNLEALVASHSGYWLQSIGPAFRERDTSFKPGPGEAPFYRHHAFIVRTAGGEAITRKQCLEAWECLRYPTGKPYAFNNRYPWWRGVGPVPGTGRRRSRLWHSYHYPKTTGALRAAEGVLEEEGEPLFRPSRRHGHLPTGWDDYALSTCGNRSWKRHRRTQWAPRTERSLRRRVAQQGPGGLQNRSGACPANNV